VSSEPRYRWHAVETLKGAQRANAALELARAERTLARAVEDAADAERALAEHAAQAPDATTSEEGTMRAFELQRAAAYLDRHGEQARALRVELTRARAHVEALQATIVQRRATLAAAHEGEQAIERDRERFERDQRKRAEQGEERELEEPRPGNRGRNPV
jgi:chromosome segregation ATPase